MPVDLKAGTISVPQALKRSKKHGLVLDEPKTARSRRLIEIGPDTIAVLKRQKKLQAEWRLKAGPVWQDTGLVCTKEDGGPIKPDTYSCMFSRLAARLGLKGSPHVLRHTHATLMLKAGVPLKVAQERLGHASIVMTGDIYSHVLPGMQRQAARLVEAALKARDQNVTTGGEARPQSREK